MTGNSFSKWKNGEDSDQLDSLEANWSESAPYSSKVIEFWKRLKNSAYIRLNMVHYPLTNLKYLEFIQ